MPACARNRGPTTTAPNRKGQSVSSEDPRYAPIIIADPGAGTGKAGYDPDMSKKALFVLFPGFEELEAVAPIDLLRRAGAEVTLASLSGDEIVVGRSGIAVKTNAPLDAVDAGGFDLLVLPGGPGTKQARADQRLAPLARAFADQGRSVAAICAAPTILADAGLLAGRRFTAHFSTYDELSSALANEAVVEDGNVITSRGAGTATAFGLALVGRLFGHAARDDVARAIMF
jgi:protein deglycase